MLSKNKLKYIKSLQLKKYRKEEQSFVVEGAKSVSELLQSDFVLTFLAATSEFLEAHSRLLPGGPVEVVTTDEKQLSSAGSLQTNYTALAIARMKPNAAPLVKPGEFVVVLDDIRDPGNLGTILRTADWYGIRHIVASPETADVYNAKTISASMGSFLRVNVFYTDLRGYLQDKKSIYGTFLEGEDVHTLQVAPGGFVVIGNESNGISKEVGGLVHRKIKIPRYGEAESLNAGVATGIILDNLRRSKK